MLEIWQNLPSLVQPSFSLFGLEIRFYSLAYLLGLLCIFGYMQLVAFRYINEDKLLNYENALFAGFLAAILGGRVFYILFYNLSYFLANPSEMFFPFIDGKFVGFYGMSFHGGLVGAALAIGYYIYTKKIDFKISCHLYLPGVALALFFGRIANFLNAELYGRITNLPIAMYFDGVLRHPSQLYEACLEGLGLFAILMLCIKCRCKVNLLSVFLFFYGSFRFIVEFVREPDSQLSLFFSWMSMGQLLSLVMIAVAITLELILDKQK
jgi:phosphatidylglycerol---prolipoprotein diacylglyceryl transferase